MKIKNKLTVIYTIIISLLLICLNIYIFYLSEAFTKNNFYTQLKDRAIIAATVFLEADEQSSSIINNYQNKYLQTLPEEIIRLYDKNNHATFIDTLGNYSFDQSLINDIRKNKEVSEDRDGRQTVGIYYQDNQGNFVIIASAVDIVGTNNLIHLKRILLAGFFISIIILFFLGRYFTKLMLKPISIISAQANRISDTNLHLRLNEGNKKDELAALSITINKMLARLENAFDLQKSFIANASHELRTPLTSIIGNIDVTLGKSRTVEEHKQVLQMLLNEAEKLQRLTNNLLDLAQSNLDFSDMKKDEIRIDEMLIEIKEEMRIKRPDSEIDLRFDEMPDDAGSVTVFGNKNLFQIAIMNLIDNACKFSDSEKVIILLSITETGIEIKIKDAGIGIDKEDLPHVKETFFRANNARPYHGSGIGMSLADKIIILHNGKIEVNSELNHGTEVTVTLNK